MATAILVNDQTWLINALNAEEYRTMQPNTAYQWSAGIIQFMQNLKGMTQEEIYEEVQLAYNGYVQEPIKCSTIINNVLTPKDKGEDADCPLMPIVTTKINGIFINIYEYALVGIGSLVTRLD